MPLPRNAFAFNEHSLNCCCSPVRDTTRMLGLLDDLRAWFLHEPKALVQELKKADDFDAVVQGMDRAKIDLLLISAVNRPSEFESATPRLGKNGVSCRGATVASIRNSFLVNWPTSCEHWNEPATTWAPDNGGGDVECRTCSTIDQFRTHCVAATVASGKSTTTPNSVKRIDKLNTSTQERPHVHFDDGSAVSIDGSWKHGGRPLSKAEEAWLSSIGWVTPVDDP